MMDPVLLDMDSMQLLTCAKSVTRTVTLLVVPGVAPLSGLVNVKWEDVTQATDQQPIRPVLIVRVTAQTVRTREVIVTCVKTDMN